MLKPSRPRLRSLSIVAVLLLAACSVNTLTSTLETITLSSEIALDVIGATGSVDPATLAQVSTYLSAVSTATSKAATILASGEPGTQQASEIIGLYQAAILPVLPPSTNPRVVAVINAVAAAVKVLLAHFGASPPAVPQGRAASIAAPATITVPKLKVTMGDKSKLHDIAKRSQVAASRAQQLHK